MNLAGMDLAFTHATSHLVDGYQVLVAPPNAAGHPILPRCSAQETAAQWSWGEPRLLYW
jgi:hypothetical protein